MLGDKATLLPRPEINRVRRQDYENMISPCLREIARNVIICYSLVKYAFLVYLKSSRHTDRVRPEEGSLCKIFYAVK